jgi:hypothetical protein
VRTRLVGDSGRTPSRRATRGAAGALLQRGLQEHQCGAGYEPVRRKHAAIDGGDAHLSRVGACPWQPEMERQRARTARRSQVGSVSRRKRGLDVRMCCHTYTSPDSGSLYVADIENGRNERGIKL